jgi:hypothetical protein
MILVVRDRKCIMKKYDREKNDRDDLYLSGFNQFFIKLFVS